MRTHQNSLPFVRTCLSVALGALTLGSQAQTTDGAETTVSIGAETSTHGTEQDRAILGGYDTMRSGRSTNLLLDIDYQLRKSATGDWVDFRATNLGTENRQADLRWRKPGSWTLTAQRHEVTHYEAASADTALQGAGTSDPKVATIVPGASVNTYTPKLHRASNGLGFSAWLNPQAEVTLSLKTEAKEGARNSGIGWNCFSAVAPNCLSGNTTNQGWGVLWLPEPVDSRHSQLEARLNLSNDRLRLSTGFYASIYRNAIGTLNPSVPSSLLDPSGRLLPLSTGLQALLSNPVALAPSSQFRQWEANGSYDFSPTTRSSFSISTARASQTDDFSSAGLANAPTGVSNLGAQVDTTLVRAALQSRPVSALSLSADVRAERRNDKTTLATYNTEGVGSSALTYTNQRISNLKNHSHLGASWQFAGPYKASLNADYEFIDRMPYTDSSAPAGIGMLRQRTEELTLRAEVRRRMADGSSASVSLASSRRDGSNWLRDVSGRGVAEITDPATQALPTSIYMPTVANRLRQVAKLFWDWQTTEALNIQISASGGYDRYDTPSAYGLRATHVNDVSVDWNYLVSDSWNLSGYVSKGGQSFLQSRAASYVMAFDNANLGAGLNIQGKIGSAWELGAKWAYAKDDNSFGQSVDPAASTYDAQWVRNTGGGLPNITWRTSTLGLFASRALDKRSSIRVDLTEQHASSTDWTWGTNGVAFAYSDGTLMNMQGSQSAGVVSVRYVIRLP